MPLPFIIYISDPEYFNITRKSYKVSFVIKIIQITALNFFFLLISNLIRQTSGSDNFCPLVELVDLDRPARAPVNKHENFRNNSRQEIIFNKKHTADLNLYTPLHFSYSYPCYHLVVNILLILHLYHTDPTGSLPLFLTEDGCRTSETCFANLNPCVFSLYVCIPTSIYYLLWAIDRDLVFSE